MREEKVSVTPISVQPSSAVCPSTLACSTGARKCMVQVTSGLTSFTPTLRDLFHALQPPFLLPALGTPLRTRRHHSCLPTHQHTNVQESPILGTDEKCTSEFACKCLVWTCVLLHSDVYMYIYNYVYKEDAEFLDQTVMQYFTFRRATELFLKAATPFYPHSWG